MRLDRVNCPICMESLFNKKDDLDEVCAVAAPDCGHVFHEECILLWFTSQVQQYIDQEQSRGRSNSVSPSEAPAECPTCRTECYADPETGKPLIHRLYINLGEAEPGSSMAGSSPVRPSRKGKEKDTEVVGLARRAKGLSDEVNDIRVHVTEEDMEGMLRRGDTLVADLASQRAVEGMRKYVGGLTASLNKLRTLLTEDLLVTQLQNRIADYDSRLRELRDKYEQLSASIPGRIRVAVIAEQDKSQRTIRKVQAESELVQRELEREQVLRRTSRKTNEEKLQEMEKRIKEAQSLAARESADREALQATLSERTKQLRAYHAKAESRREMKSRIAELETQVVQLKAESANLVRASATRIRRHRDQSHSQESYHHSNSESPAKRARHDNINVDFDVGADLDDDEIDFLSRDNSRPDTSIEELSPRTFQSMARRENGKPASRADTSLVVDMPSEASYNSDTEMIDATSPAIGKSRAVHPTARSYRSDEFGSPSKRGGLHKGNRPVTKVASKYFDSTASNPGTGARPGSLASVKVNPFASTIADTERRKRLAPLPEINDSHNLDSRPARRPNSSQLVSTSSLNQRGSASASNSNVKSSGYGQSGMTRPLSPLRNSVLNVPTRATVGKSERSATGATGGAGAGARPRASVNGSTRGAGAGGQRSIVEAMGLSDKSGRPVKGLAIGVKSHRRA